MERQTPEKERYKNNSCSRTAIVRQRLILHKKGQPCGRPSGGQR